MSLLYGKLVTQDGYRDGVAVNRIQYTEESIQVTSKKELVDSVLTQLSRLDTEYCVEFKLYADEQHQPIRIEVKGKSRTVPL